MLYPQDESDPSPNGNGLKAKVREIRVVAGERASVLGTKARERAQVQIEDQRERIATGMDSAAEGLKHHAEHASQLQQEAELRVAHGMESAATYLHSHPSEEVARDFQGIIRRHPMRSLLVALAAGYLLARLFR